MMEAPLTPRAAYVLAMAIKHRHNPNLETARQLHEAVDKLMAEYDITYEPPRARVA